MCLFLVASLVILTKVVVNIAILHLHTTKFRSIVDNCYPNYKGGGTGSELLPRFQLIDFISIKYFFNYTEDCNK